MARHRKGNLMPIVLNLTTQQRDELFAVAIAGNVEHWVSQTLYSYIRNGKIDDIEIALLPGRASVYLELSPILLNMLDRARKKCLRAKRIGGKTKPRFTSRTQLIRSIICCELTKTGIDVEM